LHRWGFICRRNRGKRVDEYVCFNSMGNYDQEWTVSLRLLLVCATAVHETRLVIHKRCYARAMSWASGWLIQDEVKTLPPDLDIIAKSGRYCQHLPHPIHFDSSPSGLRNQARAATRQRCPRPSGPGSVQRSVDWPRRVVT
jgi:hypothetical protein